MQPIFKENHSILLKVIFAAILFCALFVFYYCVVLALPYNSDHASILVEAKAILDGNILLKGWTLSTVSYYTTEIPFYIIGILLFGFSEKVIYIVTAITYALLTFIIIFLCSVSSDGKINVKRLVLTLCFSLFIASLLSTWKLLSPVHVVGFTYCVSSIFCLQNSDVPISWKKLIVWSLLLLLAFTGDSFTLYAWGIPVILVFVYKLITDKNKSQYFKLFAATLFSIFLSKMFLRLSAVIGRFALPGIAFKFVDQSSLGKNLYLFFVGLLDLFSVNFIGQPFFSIHSIINFIHLLGLLVFILVLFRSVRNFTKISTISQIFIVGIILNLAEYLGSNAAVDRATVRYLMFSLILFILLCANILSESNLLKKRALYFYLFCFLLGASLIPPMSTSMPNLSFNKLDDLLVEKHLHNGYGLFWAAATTTVHTQGSVSISPVVSPDGVSISPYHWLSDENWFSKDSNFLVIDSNQSFGLSAETAINTFGKPKEIYPVEDYTVLVWDKNISPDLNKVP